jgi:hypothetical protein
VDSDIQPSMWTSLKSMHPAAAARARPAPDRPKTFGSLRCQAETHLAVLGEPRTLSGSAFEQGATTRVITERALPSTITLIRRRAQTRIPHSSRRALIPIRSPTTAWPRAQDGTGKDRNRAAQHGNGQSKHRVPACFSAYERRAGATPAFLSRACQFGFLGRAANPVSG